MSANEKETKSRVRKITPYPSTANNRNQMKFSSGCTKGGPFSIEGCFCVYVVKTTEALVLFFKQRNLQKETEQGKVKNREEYELLGKRIWRGI